MKKLVLLMATLALVLLPLTAQAMGWYESCTNECTDFYTAVDNDIDVSLDTDVEKDIDVDIQVVGSEYLYGYYDEYDGYWWWGEHGLTVDGMASAVIDNKQILKWNFVDNWRNSNTAEVTDDTLKNAEGNIAANVVAGDNNAQDNAVAATVSEVEKSLADAEIFKTQLSFVNTTYNWGMTNSATVDGNALMNADGNIGLNVAAGNNNAQSNMLAVACAPTKVGIASVNIVQQSSDNYTENYPDWELFVLTDTTRIAIDGSISGSMEGTYSGTSDQIGDVYPDIWEYNPEYASHEQHPHSPQQTGHFDLDNETQGGSDLNGDGGCFAFNEEGDMEGTIELDDVDLAGTVSITRNVWLPVLNTTNTASLSGSALMNASGNIGVNIAAGTGNLQANALAVTCLSAATNGGVAVAPEAL